MSTTTDRTFRRVLAFLLLVAAVLVFVTVVALRNLGRATATSEWVNHTHATRAAAAEILSSLHAAEAALRTFLINGNPQDHAVYRAAFSDLAEQMEVAKALTRHSPAEHAQMLQLEELLAKRADVARETIRIWREQPAELPARFAADPGGDSLREISRFIQRFRNEQAELLNERDRVSYLQAQTTRWTVLTGIVFDFLLLAGVAWLIRDDLRARQRAADAMREANEKLEARVQERTVEIRAANSTLKAQALEDRWTRQAIEHQLHYNHLIINSMAELAIVVTRTLAISRINPAVEHLSGRESSELVDRPLGEFISLTNPPADGDPLARAMKDARELRDQAATLLAKSGQRHAVELNFIPLRDGNKVVGGIITLRPLRSAAS